MNLKRFASLTVATAILTLSAEVMAHGGQYRGPGDTVPPNPGGGSTGSPGRGGPTTPNPGGPTTPNPGGPTTPGPTTGGPPAPTTGGGAAGGGRGPTTQGGGITLGDPLDEWQFWWEFNKDPFLQLKKAIHTATVQTGSDDFIMGRGKKDKALNTLRPGESDRRRIITELKQALKDNTNRDIISSCLIALAKVGGDLSILPVFKEYLPDNDQEKRETACLAMGIASLEPAVPDLIALALDTEDGRKLVKRSTVDFRTRSFACYGLGLIAHDHQKPELQRKIFEAMKTMADADKSTHRDLIVSPLQCIRLLRPDDELRKEIIAYLYAYMQKTDKEVYAQVRSHAYVAIAALLGRGGDKAGAITKLMTADIKNRRQKPWIHQSAILALGKIATPDNDAVSDAIQDYFKKGKDLQGKNFAAIALGQIGGAKNRTFLITQMRRGRQLQKPWAALGLGILDFEQRQRQGANYEGDKTAAEAIKSAFDKTRNPLYSAGMAIALGMMKYKDAGDDIMDRLEKIKNNSEPAGYLAVALGLMRYQSAKDMINTLLDSSTRREKLLSQCAIALGLLGDKEVGLKLADRIQQKVSVAVYSALAQGLGFIGDKRSVTPLIEMLKNQQLRALPRAFAAVALGLVGEKADLPWNSKIAVDNNYRANVETLTGAGAGILDIL